MQIRIVRKPAWRRRLERCEDWLRNSNYRAASFKVRNMSTSWVCVATFDRQAGYRSNYIGMGAGDRRRFFSFGGGLIQVTIEVPAGGGPAAATEIVAVIDLDFLKHAELHLFDDDGDDSTCSTAATSE